MKRSGSITKHGDRFRIRLSLDGKRHSLGMAKSYEEARGIRDAAIRQAEEKDGHLKRGKTLRTWGEDFLNERELDGHHRSVPKDRLCWKAGALKAPFIDEPMRKIKTSDVVLWVRSMIKAGLARSTVKNRLNLVRVALEEAVFKGYISENPARTVQVPRKASTATPERALPMEHVNAILTAPLADHARYAYAVLLYTGLRPGELWGLHWSDVHLKGERPHLVVRYSRKQATKTGVVREVPLLAPAREALEAWRRVSPAAGKVLVFRTRDDTMHHDGYDCGWRKHRKALGLPSARLYDFRHTCASHLLRGSWGRVWSMGEVQQWMGHRSIKTTEIYAKYVPGGIRDAALATANTGHLLDTASRIKKTKPLSKVSE